MKRISGKMKVGILLEKTNKTITKRQLGRMRKLEKYTIRVYMFEKKNRFV
jgi:hypothetical protein